jgi:hypothetical protein
MDESLPEEERITAFNTRATWYRWLEGGSLSQVNQMITDFGKLGIVERQEGPKDGDLFPPLMFVESQVGFTEDVPIFRNTIIGPAEKVTRSPRQIKFKVEV